MHGTQYWICPISAILLMLLIIYVFLPVFYKLQLVSTYEYLKIRFDHRIRTLASLLFILCTLLYVPIVIYVPALAFNQSEYRPQNVSGNFSKNQKTDFQ